MKYKTLIDIPGIPVGTESELAWMTDDLLFKNLCSGTNMLIRAEYAKRHPELFAPIYEKEFTINDMRNCWLEASQHMEAGQRFAAFERYIQVVRNRKSHQC